MNLGTMVIITALFGAAVAAFAALRSKGGVVRPILIGLISALSFFYLWEPIAEVGDPYFLESQLRLTAIVIFPIILSAAVGSWVRRTRMKRGKI